MRKIALLIAAVMIMLTVFAGCAPKETAPAAAGDQAAAEPAATEEKVTLKVMGWTKEENFKFMFDTYTAKYPNVTVEYQFVDNKSYDTALNTQLASGSGPDVILVGAQTKDLAAAGYLADISGEAVVQKYHQAGLDAFMYEGKVYAVPESGWMEGIFYNIEHFEKAGVSVPKTWDEFLDAHKALKAAGYKIPQVMHCASWEPQMKQSIAQANAWVHSVNPEFSPKFGKGEGSLYETWLDPFKDWGRIVKEGYITQDMLSLDYNQAQDMFALGKASMWESGNWAVNDIKTKNPDLKFAFFPIPAKNGEGWVIGGPGAAWAVREGGNREYGLKLLEVWSTQEVQGDYQKANSGPMFLKDFNNELPSQLDGAGVALSAGRIYAPWNDWMGASEIIQTIGKGLQEFIRTGDDKTIEKTLKDADAARDAAVKK
ncbi:MAG TPA: extracellular solute-binding protein [Clostridia bacterium]|nr:extracellular solute-binding protein [Clostridia bacterium]